MEASLRPHRGGIVLGLGILGLLTAFVLLPLGIVAWILGSKDLRGMKAGTVDPSGYSLTQVGWVLGIVGTVAWIPVALLVLLVMTATWNGATTTSSSSAEPGVRHVSVSYPEKMFFNQSKRAVMLEYGEVQVSTDTWVKDGPYVHSTQDGTRIEEGFYERGKRTGRWSFRNDDGSIDYAKSGVYENDVKVRD